MSQKKSDPKVAVLIRTGDEARNARKWHEAAEAYGAALEIQEEMAPIWVQYGHALKESGDVSSALKAYHRAVDIDPKNPDTHLQLGHAHKVAGRKEAALASYTRAIELDEGLFDARREIDALTSMGVRMPVDDASETGVLDNNLWWRNGGFSDYELEKRVPVSIVGKFGSSNGIGLHADTFIRTLGSGSTDGLQLIDTRPSESDQNYRPFNQRLEFTRVENARPALTSVYCDVIANSPSDENINKVPESIARYAYAVFDSSRVPEFWTARLNEFDAVLVPSGHLIEILKKSGVYRPIFALPLALDFSSLNSEQQAEEGITEGDVTTFGCIAGYSQRKNLDELVQAFNDVFGDTKDVRLLIHSTLNFSNNFERLEEKIAKKEINNIAVSCGHLSSAEYAALFSSFDIYVNVSKGEGYSITPRQALYLGKPTILSDNTAHREIVESGLVIPVPTCGFEPALYEGIGGQSFGFQCIPDPQELRRSLVRAVREYPRWRAKSGQMRDFANRFSVAALEWHYKAALAPKDVFFGDRDKITKSYLITKDTNLYSKLSLVREARKSAVPVHSRQRITVIGHDGGFFSVFNTFVSHLVWNIGRPEVTSIVPDWRISEIQRYRKTDKFTSFCYGQRSDGNLWLKFCYPVPSQAVSEECYNDDEFLRQGIIYDDFNEQREPWLTYIHAYKLYKSEGFSEWRRWYNNFYRKFIRFRERITTAVDVFRVNSFADGVFVIGCHVRHPSHAIEQPGRSIPTVELFIRHIIERSAGLSKWKVYLATDQQSVVDQFEGVFGERLLVRRDVARTGKGDDARYNALSSSEQMKEGHQIQHLTAADEERWSTRMGDDVIIDALLLASCDAFIHITSNIATAVSFMNPEIEMIYCE